MRKTIKLMGIALCTLMVYQGANAQSVMGEQNPNYRVSMDKYMVLVDSITRDFGTTEQNTYKAYDWYEAKQERKAQKKQWRHEERMERAKNRGYYSNSYYDGYYGNGYNTGYYNNYHSRGWGWNLIPRIGFNTGNWSFYW
ncbi:MAG: hypothetical protein LBE34_05155 [Flavobacteriaceae bacterium]|jgi:hypothetical protein|nr:hypothetical protein [Flavobacteriaceae bacterium]